MSKIDHKTILVEKITTDLNRRGFLKGAAGVTAGAMLGMGASAAQAQATGAQHITLATVKHIDTLDPHFTGFPEAIKIINNIHNGLLKVTYDGKKVAFVPDLAETWEIVDDRVHTFKLRPNVKFHDGAPFDAEAVKFNLERVAKGQPKSPHAWKLDLLEKIEIIDPLTVRLTFSKPYAFLPVALTGSTGRAGTMVSPAAVAKFGKDYGRNPVGTGPFKFVSWRENAQIELVKNPEYFEAGLPKLDKVTFRIMPEASTAAAALLSGQVHGMSDCPPQFLPQMKANKNLNIYGEIEGNYFFLGMNCKKGPFQDPNLRLAVAFALDREAMIRQAFFGQGIPAYTPISPPMTDFYDPNVGKSGRGQRFDLEKAKAYRARVANQGVIEPVFIVSEQGNFGSRIAQTALPMLEKIGIKPRIELLERAAWVSRRNSGDFDMLDFGWEADLDPDETLFPEFKTAGPWNFWGWSDPRFDAACAAAQATLNLDERKKLYTQAEDILLEEPPIALLTHMPIFKVLSSKVKGFEYVPVDLLNLHTVSLG